MYAQETAQFKIYEIDDVLIDMHLKEVAKNSRIVRPEPETFKTLVYLIENRDRWVSLAQLREDVWEDPETSEFELLRAIMLARKALADNEYKNLIQFNKEIQAYRFNGNVLELEIQ